MNEQSQQAYLNLIKKLIASSNGQELEILTANKELLDIDFLQTVEVMSRMLGQQGYEDTANWLQHLAAQLRKGLRPDNTIDLQFSSREVMQQYYNLLSEVIKVNMESKGNAQVVYPLLANNIDKLDEVFAQILYEWGTNQLQIIDVHFAKNLAATIFVFSELILQFSLGKKSNNIEIAISGFKVALAYFTRDAFPEVWASTQNYLASAYIERIKGERITNLEHAIAYCENALTVYNINSYLNEWQRAQQLLGLAYNERIKGEQSENLEVGIACFENALKFYTFNSSPYGWAQLQSNLGTAYISRIKGDKAENLEIAIAYFHNALQVYTCSTYPYEWANQQTNLGLTYTYRVRGERAENLELAFAYFQEALKVNTFDAYPYEWAQIQNNLGINYRRRIRGERAENLEQAIACYNEALNVCTLTNYPYLWGKIQINLSLVYRERIRGERTENLELAIISCRKALQIFTMENSPQEWASIQNNLGLAYRERVQGERSKNLELAITCYHDALKVRTFESFAQDWADTQNNLGLAYSDTNKPGDLEQAITCYHNALKVRTLTKFPQDWAQTQSNLGFVYAKTDESSNLELAIACYHEALKIRTFDSFPQYYAETLFKLGLTYQNAKQFTQAYETFALAINAIESLRSEIISGQESKQKQAEAFNQVYSCMVEVCLQLGKITEALEYAEGSKTRNLVEQILENDSNSIFPQDVATKLETYRDEIAIGQQKIQNRTAENARLLAQNIQELRQQRNELQNSYLPIGNSFKFDSFQANLNNNTVIIEWYILATTFVAFIITRTEIKVWQSQLEDRIALGDWIAEYINTYYKQKEQWQNDLEKELKKLSSLLHLDHILTYLPKSCEKLILIPHRFLHLFPIHALQTSQNSVYLLDLFARGISYAPSCQILQQIQHRKRSYFQNLFAIQNPTNDLTYTDLEVQVIQSLFSTYNILKNEAATLSAINNIDLNTYHCAHFSCHGVFNLVDPNKSALILSAEANNNLKEDLTLDKIFTLELKNCCLVTLSACETGLIDIRNTSDEYIGLPSGFLLAGSQAVVSSLWSVSDFSTAFLMIKFYENLQTMNNISLAFNQAQQWLRNLTIEELERYIEQDSLQIKQVLAQWRPGQRKLIKEYLERKRQDQSLPFKNPYYWAAFTLTGF